MPSEYFLSLTILTKNSGFADALSTALFCMSYEEGSALVEKLEDVEAIWIFPDGKVVYSSGVTPYEPENK